MLHVYEELLVLQDVCIQNAMKDITQTQFYLVLF